MLRLTLGLMCVVCSTVRAGDVLEWESKKGHKTQATFEGLEIVLTKEDGQKIRVRFDALSVASQEQVLRLIKEAEVPQVRQEPKEEKRPDVLPPAKLQKLLEEIKEIKRQARLQGSTARNSLFLKEEMSKLDKRYGKAKVRFAFPVKDVFKGEGSFKLKLGSYRMDGSYLSFGMDPPGVMCVGGRFSVTPNVTEQEMMAIGEGTHEYEVICEMSASNLSGIVDKVSSSPPVKQADCKLVRIRGR